VDDLEMALHKMARHARLRACLSHPANGFFVGREILALLGAKPPVLPDPLLALGMLRRMGAHPRVVHFLMPSRLAGCASFDEFEQRLRWSTGPLDEGARHRLQTWFTADPERAQRGGGPMRWAFVGWNTGGA
jgi:hypothetical protein